MKKRVRILCIAGGVILAAGAAVFALVPGLFTYFQVKWKYRNIEKTIPVFTPYSVPSDFVPYTVEGLCISVPADYTLRDNGRSFLNADGKTAVFLTRHDQTLMSQYVDPWDSQEYAKADYRSYFDAVGAPFPTDTDARTELLWYCKGTLMPKDCLKLRGTDRKVFKELAATKNGAWEMEDTWELAVSGAKGYVSRARSELVSAVADWTLTVYPDDSRSDKIFIVFRTDDTTAKQMVSSVQLSPK
ncbi:MAG: hypothetical protein IJ060_01105 [Oscillospiraceae bacterium]|nr:hypothetical protein [Oscillospiraceae bacterium]